MSHQNLAGIVVGPAIWGLHFLLCYLTVALICARGWAADGGLGAGRTVVAIATLLAAIAIAAAMVAAWRRWRQVRGLGAADAGLEPRQRFLAAAGALLAGLSLLGTLWTGLPAVFVTTCQ